MDNPKDIKQLIKPERVKSAQIHMPSDLMAQQQTFRSNANTEILDLGNKLEVHSKKTGRTIRIPLANIRAYEMIKE